METLRREALFHLGLASTALALVTVVYQGSAPLALALFASIAVLVWRGLRWHGHPSFGPANAVTMLRAAITAALGGLLLAEPIPTLAAAAAGGIALLLDGVDGPLARRSGLSSAFGARFDMEVDAFLVLVLSALVLATGRAGAWVLALGGLRYVWVAGGMLVPALGAELPPSRRRQVICGAVVAILVAALVVPAWLSSPLCAAAFLGLIYSFGVDLLRVIRPMSGFRG
jgi:phosphatidylglycerophosphate synthase